MFNCFTALLWDRLQLFILLDPIVVCRYSRIVSRCCLWADLWIVRFVIKRDSHGVGIAMREDIVKVVALVDLVRTDQAA